MKKFIAFLLLPLCLAAGAQSLCIQTQCLATKARVGDTVQLAAILTTAKGFGSLTYTLQPGAPNTPTVAYSTVAYTTGLQAQQNIRVTNAVAGTYIWQVVGKDQAGGVVYGVDSLIVAPAIAACPTPRTVTGLQVYLFGTWFTVPISPANTKFTLSDGATQ